MEYEADDKNGFNAVVHKIGTPKHEEYRPKVEEYHPKVQEYHQNVEEYHPKVEEYHQKAEEYHARPAHEPIAYNHDYGHFDEGFVPVVGYGRH